ncbi:tyrosine-type recombinase/integrase [Rossellomorea marisflavi]|uniref:tyrosine-type recombinase/integrase n=1 Tax=Rossellomorea marisflavi TaxID=189381 RepID=UPI00345C88E2
MASFRKRGTTWQYRIKYKDHFTLQPKEISKGGFKTKKEAQLHASKAEDKIRSGVEQDGSELLKDYLYEWLEDYKQGNVRKNTYILHERNVKTKIVPYFKDIKLNAITPIMYQKFINYLSKEGYSKRTVEIIHTTMSNALKTAVRPLKKLSENPCDGVTIPKQTKSKSEKDLEYINSSDVNTFLRLARQDNYLYYIFFRTLLETGMRKGEAAALQRSDVDLKNGYIEINKSLDFQVKEEESVFGDTKTYESRRRIKIGSALNKELTNHLKWINENKVVFNEVYRHDYDLFFCRENGEPLPKSTLFNSFRRITNKMGIPPLPIHGLRHTHAVMLLESGADLKFVSDRLGHKDIQITANVYSHISKQLEDKSVDKFESYMDNLMS